MNIWLLVVLFIWFIAIVQWAIIYNLNEDIKKILIDLSEPRIGVKNNG